MEKTTEFDEIRPYYDDELPKVFEELTADSDFKKIIGHIYPNLPIEQVVNEVGKCKSKSDFQKNFSSVFLWNIAFKTTDGLTLDISSLSDKEMPYTYISNHRDIVLDSGFLSILLLKEGLDTVEIAIGDNLLFLPWIKQLVRVNKSFIVQRALSMRQMLESSLRLSKYMHYAISEKKESLWIAQREGRAKDSNDRTQESVLKMLAMGGEGDIADRLRTLNMLPLAISYEYDPCDYLKAEEFQLKRDDADYKKTFQDDLKNMETGIYGYKGRVCFRTGTCLNDQLGKLDSSLSKQESFAAMSAMIDKEIHRNYTIYPINYIAYDLLKEGKHFADQYSVEQVEQFENYLTGQMNKFEKIDEADRDIPFLRERMLTMYANPLINYLKVIEG